MFNLILESKINEKKSEIGQLSLLGQKLCTYKSIQV